MPCSAQCSLLLAKAGFFFCGGLGISKSQFLIKKDNKNFSRFLFNIWSSKPWIRIRIH
jgi:hypothetical protein